MASAVLEATQAVGSESQRQILLVTDGLIGFEGEIITSILKRMPVSSRFHVVAVGSAPNRSLTAAAARAGRGIERGVMLGEDPARWLVNSSRTPPSRSSSISRSAVQRASKQRRNARLTSSLAAQRVSPFTSSRREAK